MTCFCLCFILFELSFSGIICFARMEVFLGSWIQFCHTNMIYGCNFHKINSEKTLLREVVPLMMRELKIRDIILNICAFWNKKVQHLTMPCVRLWMLCLIKHIGAISIVHLGIWAFCVFSDNGYVLLVCLTCSSKVQILSFIPISVGCPLYLSYMIIIVTLI